MLVLSRKSGERVLLGKDIDVVVLEIGRNQVKLGFTAPRYVPICRAEIHQELADSLFYVPITPCEGETSDSSDRATEALS